MLRYLLDTHLSIQVLRDRPPELRPRFIRCAEELCISDVVLYELLYGAARSLYPVCARHEVEHFAARLAALPFDSEAAAHTADIRAEPEWNGSTIGSYDLMIAGHARSRRLIVVTRNFREFARWRGFEPRTG